MLGHGAGRPVGYTGPNPQMGPIDNFSWYAGVAEVNILGWPFRYGGTFLSLKDKLRTLSNVGLI